MTWPRSDTLPASRVTWFNPGSSDPAQGELMCVTPQVLPPQPISELLRGSPVLGGESVRVFVRSWFVPVD